MDEPNYSAGPDGTLLRIYRDTAQNPFQTEQRGIPTFDEVIMVEVITPGATGSSPVHEVERVFFDKNVPPRRGARYEAYASQIEDFKKREGDEAGAAGTPLKEWPEISRSLAATLRAQNIFTVEALAGVADSRLNAIGPEGRVWREKARAYIEQTKEAGAATRYAAENERLRMALEDQQALLANQQRTLETLTAQIAALGGQAVQSTSETPVVPNETPPSTVQAAAQALGDII